MKADRMKKKEKKNKVFRETNSVEANESRQDEKIKFSEKPTRRSAVNGPTSMLLTDKRQLCYLEVPDTRNYINYILY